MEGWAAPGRGNQDHMEGIFENVEAILDKVDKCMIASAVGIDASYVIRGK